MKLSATLLALLSFAAVPALAQTPVVVPTLPVPAPVVPLVASAPLPVLSAAQADYLTIWLQAGADQGLGAASTGAAPVIGDALVRATLDRARALHSGRIDTADFLEVWALRPAAYDPLPAFAAAVATDRLAQWATALTPPYAGYEALRKGLAR